MKRYYYLTQPGLNRRTARRGLWSRGECLICGRENTAIRPRKRSGDPLDTICVWCVRRSYRAMVHDAIRARRLAFLSLGNRYSLASIGCGEWPAEIVYAPPEL